MSKAVGPTPGHSLGGPGVEWWIDDERVARDEFERFQAQAFMLHGNQFQVTERHGVTRLIIRALSPERVMVAPEGDDVSYSLLPVGVEPRLRAEGESSRVADAEQPVPRLAGGTGGGDGLLTDREDVEHVEDFLNLGFDGSHTQIKERSDAECQSAPETFEEFIERDLIEHFREAWDAELDRLLGSPSPGLPRGIRPQ